MVCPPQQIQLSHTLWSGRPLTRRMRAQFHRVMVGLYLPILPDLTHHLSLTGGKDSRVSLMWFSALHFNAFTTLHSRFANEQIRIRWPEDAGTAAQFVCVRCCGLRVLRVWWFGFEPDATSCSRVNKSHVWGRQSIRNKNRNKVLLDTLPWTPLANDTTHQMGEFAKQS